MQMLTLEIGGVHCDDRVQALEQVPGCRPGVCRV